VAAAPADVDPGRNAMLPPIVQLGAAGATVTAAGVWLWLEWMRQKQAEAAEAALQKDRSRWYDRVMDLNRLERDRRQALEVAHAAGQKDAAAQYKQLVDGLEGAIDQGARLHAIRDFVDRHEGDVFKDGVWDPEAMARLQNRVQRLGLSQADRDLYQAKVNFMDTVGPVTESVFELSRSMWVRIGTGILSGGYSEAAWIPLSALDSMWQTVNDPTASGAARSSATAATGAYVKTFKDTLGLILWNQVFTQGAQAFSPEIKGLGRFLKDDFSRWWSVNKVKDLWARVPPGTQAQLTGYADDAWNAMTRPLGSSKPSLPVIRHEWGKPVTYLDAPTPLVQRLNTLRLHGLEDDVASLMSKATRGGLQLTNVRSLKLGESVALSADEVAALRVMQHSQYRQLLGDGVIPREIHAAAVHARDVYIKGQASVAYSNLSPAMQDNMVRIDFTGAGARPHSPAATSVRFTDLDLTPRGTPTPQGAAAESAFRKELSRLIGTDPTWGEFGFNANTTDVNIFSGLRPRPLNPPHGGYGGARFTYWQEADTTFRGRSAIASGDKMIFDVHPDVRPMPGQGPIAQGLQAPPVPTGQAARDAGRVIQQSISKLENQLGRAPTPLEIMVKEGKQAHRVWWANHRGTGTPTPPWIQNLNDLKLHPTVIRPPEQIQEMWEGLRTMFEGHVDFGGTG
jgi:hypothetical protein